MLPFGRLWYDTADNAAGYAMHSSRSRDAVIRVYDDAVRVIETHDHTRDFKEWQRPVSLNWQVVRQFVGYPYDFGEFQPGSDFVHAKKLGKNV